MPGWLDLAAESWKPVKTADESISQVAPPQRLDTTSPDQPAMTTPSVWQPDTLSVQVENDAATAPPASPPKGKKPEVEVDRATEAPCSETTCFWSDEAGEGVGVGGVGDGS